MHQAARPLILKDHRKVVQKSVSSCSLSPLPWCMTTSVRRGPAAIVSSGTRERGRHADGRWG